jgi:putative hemolysin
MTIHEIEQAVRELSPKELARFRQWFDEFDAQIWDEQFERDVNSGKLDKLADQAVSDFRAGKAKEL